MMHDIQRHRSLLIRASLWWVLAAGAVVASSCGDDGEYSSARCRFEPEDCNGGAGTFCDRDRDCLEGLFCCRDDSNCGGGMCTADCRRDRDCPRGMRCEHEMCFYACEVDEDCAEGMGCEHGRTVCEWP
jgi:hypothetical protein